MVSEKSPIYLNARSFKRYLRSHGKINKLDLFDYLKYFLIERKEAHIRAVFKYAGANKDSIVHMAYILAISKSNVAAYKLLRRINPYYDDSFFRIALDNPVSLRMVKLTYRNGIELCEQNLINAILVAKKSVLNFLVKKGYDFCSINEITSKVNHQVSLMLTGERMDFLTNEKVTELVANGYLRGYTILSKLVAFGTLDWIKILHEHGVSLTERFHSMDYDVDHFLHEKGIGCYFEGCVPNCAPCRGFRRKVLSNLWDMEDYEYDNIIQWLPRETFDDVFQMI